MKILSATKVIAACAVTAAAMPAFSHIVLENRAAAAGSTYKAVFQVGHGCNGSSTTAISVQIPPGFQGAKPYPKAGWTLSTQLDKLAKPYTEHGKQVSEDVTMVTWTAASKDAALKETYFDEFMLRGKLPDTAGPMWFKVLQTCESGSNNWNEVPASGTSTQGLKSPAALLEVTGLTPVAQQLTAPGQPVQVTGAWVRATVAGQKSSGAFMKITSKAATRLVGVSSPVAGVAEVHEMKMDGDVMKMRALDGLDLPAGKTVELKAGGYHVMMMDLKQPLKAGSTVPVTLMFKDAKGVKSKLDVQLPVSVHAPGAATGGKPAETEMDHSAHKH
ncbi:MULTISPECIES: DUF1775 domain-containing protein [Polaromonas]|uniref:DUF1775 domain-containing protein n=1 Tax=Polaromonas aquatica TaxID=332657 RepID=A0ABW1U1K7_9BURK